MLCDKSINLNTAADAVLRPFTAGTFRVIKFVQENGLYNRLHAHIWLHSQILCNSRWHVCKSDLVHAFLTTEQRDEQPRSKKESLGSGTPLLPGASCVSAASSPYNSTGRATLRLYNSLTQCNSTTAKKVLHADMRLSFRSDDCWFSHVFSAVTGLVQDYMFKEKLRNCEPIDISRFVVNLRERHLNF